MGRMLSGQDRAIRRAASVALCAGTLMALSGCAGSGASRARSAGVETPVNTGLASIDRRPDVSLPHEDELMALGAEEASVKQRIAESARQLEFYFTNMEINAPSEAVIDDPVQRTVENDVPAGAASTPASNNQVSREPPVRVAQPPQPNPEVARDDGGGVRSSLLALAGGDERSGEEDAPAQAESDAEGVIEPTPGETADAAAGGDAGGSPGVESVEVTGPVDPEPEPIEMTPEARRDALAGELAVILSEMVALGDDPGASAVALASLETLLPEDVGSLVDSGVLSEPELATLNAVRDLLSSMVNEGSIMGPHELGERLESMRVRLAEWSGVTITRAALCTRVDGFGRFQTFPSYRFRAGQEHEIIVYVELEDFSQRESLGPDGMERYSIELSQRLELYHVADDLNTWNRSADTVRDESRNRLRDYYLTNRVWLPPNLGVGRYHLKVVMRDLVGERMAESIIPIEIVSQ